MTNMFRFVTLALFIALPVVCYAQDAAPVDSGAGIPIAAIVAALGALAAVLGAVMNWIPAGYRTYANLAAAALATIIPTLTDLSASGQTVTLAATIAALVGAVIGKRKATRGE